MKKKWNLARIETTSDQSNQHNISKKEDVADKRSTTQTQDNDCRVLDKDKIM